MAADMTEADLEMLETYLDDALTDRELADAARRIAAEPQLAAELESLRAQRAMRRAVFAAMEPTDGAVERLLGRVDESIRRRSWFERQLRWGKWASAAAACVIVGFAVGQMGRGGAGQPGGGVATGPQNSSVPPTQVAASDGGQAGGATDAASEHGQIKFVARLTDDAGRVIAEQPFESAEKATEFVHDVQTWSDRQRQVQNGNYVFTSGKF